MRSASRVWCCRLLGHGHVHLPSSHEASLSPRLTCWSDARVIAAAPGDALVRVDVLHDGSLLAAYDSGTVARWQVPFPPLAAPITKSLLVPGLPCPSTAYPRPLACVRAHGGGVASLHVPSCTGAVGDAMAERCVCGAA